MGLSSWKDQYRFARDEWPMERFVGIAEEVLELLGIDEKTVPNERLVRYYVAEGAMSKPVRDGREVRYGYRHLVELLVTRMLLKDGWPLSKVAGFISGSDPDALEQMLPEQAPTAAQREVRAIKRAMSQAPLSPPQRFADAAAGSLPSPPAPASASASASDSDIDPAIDAKPRAAFFSRSVAEPPEGFRDELFGAPASASQKMLDLQGTMARGRSTVSQLLHSIGFGKHKPEWRDTASIDLTPWCTVTFDAEQLRRLPHSAYEPLGEALAQSLREHRMATRRDRK